MLLYINRNHAILFIENKLFLNYLVSILIKTQHFVNPKLTMAKPIVSVQQGHLKGVTDIDLNGDKFYKFLGIPYAKPPVGPLRFKAPQPADSWTGVRDATKEGNPCLSLDTIRFNTVGSEDCLYLNVFTKELPRAGLSPKPVMVFIHGGAFTMGSGSEQMQGAKHLVSEDVVLVTINYRLGVLGFLSSDDLSLDIPGNAGLKDQTFALKWVQDNITSFNGDPNNVTIFGVSAGGASVHFQVLSPTAKGLFHKAIAQSGVAINPWAWGQKNAIQVAQKLGKTVYSDKDALDILMNVSADELYQVSLQLPDVILGCEKRRPFGPVIEKPNPTAFLTKNPTDLLESGNFNQVPLIQGFTSNEGLFSDAQQEKISLKGNVRECGPYWALGLEEKSQKHAKIKALINNFYFKDGETTEAKHKLIGDVALTIGIIKSVKLAAKTSRMPVYLYVFSYEIGLHQLILEFMGIKEKTKGVVHGGDQMFLFNNQLGANVGSFTLDPKLIEESQVGIKEVIKIWTEFARTGRPHVLWKPVTNVNELKYFDISKNPKLKVNPFEERVALWESIFREVPIFNAHLHENASF